MKVNPEIKKSRIEILPLIDIVFLLLVFFIYAMLSMVVHKSLEVDLPDSFSAKTDNNKAIVIYVKKDGSLYLDAKKVSLNDIKDILKSDTKKEILIAADKKTEYNIVFSLLDMLKNKGIKRISLQAKTASKDG